MGIFDGLKKVFTGKEDLPLYARPNEKIAQCVRCAEINVIHKSEMRNTYYCLSCKSN